MKPRLWMDRGVWVCTMRYLTMGGRITVHGHGYNPAQAYEDMRVQLWGYWR